MNSSTKSYAGFLGAWVLIPESCQYEQGSAPREGRYVISDVEGSLHFQVAWTDADGGRHEVTFAGKPDGAPVAFAGGDLVDAISISSASARRLDSAAYKDGEVLMLAERQLDEGGNAMRVVQQVRLPDGSRPTNISVYQKQVSN